jgi:hypothetical protein
MTNALKSFIHKVQYFEKIWFAYYFVTCFFISSSLGMNTTPTPARRIMQMSDFVSPTASVFSIGLQNWWALFSK